MMIETLKDHEQALTYLSEFPWKKVILGEEQVSALRQKKSEPSQAKAVALHLGKALSVILPLSLKEDTGCGGEPEREKEE